MANTLYELFSGGLTAEEHRKKSKYKALQQRKNPTAKEDILPILEMITGASASGERGQKGTLSEAMLATPVLGHIGKGMKFGKYITKALQKFKNNPTVRLSNPFDLRKFPPQYSGKPFTGKEVFSQAHFKGKGFNESKNREIIDALNRANWKRLGTTGSGFNNIIKKTEVFAPSKPLTEVSGRKVSAVIYKDKKGTTVQPFYKSSGTGTPKEKTKGKWLPFEGFHTKAGRIKGVNITKGDKTLDQGMLYNPGWFIKGYKKPGNIGKIFDSADAGRIKRGQPIHEETGTMLKYFNKDY